MSDRERREVSRRVLGITLILLAVFTVAQNFYYVRVQARIVACQAEFTDEFTSALRARSEATDQDREAMDTLIFAIARADEPGETRRALQEYVALREQTDQERSENPFPSVELPEDCIQR